MSKLNLSRSKPANSKTDEAIGEPYTSTGTDIDVSLKIRTPLFCFNCGVYFKADDALTIYQDEDDMYLLVHETCYVEIMNEFYGDADNMVEEEK